MNQEILIQHGVPRSQAMQATQLYCAAFLEKLSPFLGPAERAAAFLERGMVPERAFVALRRGEVVGIAGFKQSGKGLFEPSLAQFMREYGVSAPLRLLGLAVLERAEDADYLLMDGIAVAEPVRGQGIGTRLLRAIESHAASLGKIGIRLDVIDTNPRARRLYERRGFQPGKTTDLGPLRRLFNFKTATTMAKVVTAQG